MITEPVHAPRRSEHLLSDLRLLDVAPLGALSAYDSTGLESIHGRIYS